MRLSRYLVPVALLLLLLTSFRFANACSCVRPGPPCGYYGNATAVFLGRVVGSVERKSYVDQNGAKTVYDVGTIRFLVQENFKGANGYEVEIHSGTGGGDCGYWFLRNESYVVYAYQSSEDNKLYTNICTRTSHISKATEDLEFLRGLAAAKPGGTLYGQLRQFIGDREHGPFTEGPKMAGVKVLIKGANQSFEAVTNDAGEYRVADLPPGDYDAFPDLPDKLGAISSHDTVDRFGSYSGHKPVRLSERGCAEMSFSVQFSGLVSGKVTDAKGQPVKEVHLNLAREEDAEKEWSAWTDEDGRYEFHLVQPGNYLLGFNLRWAPDKDDPYPKTYYPGVKDRSEAALITVGDGTKHKGYDLTLPARLSDRLVKVTVVWPDGRPAVDASVNYETTEGYGTSLGARGTTDAKGVVAIRFFDSYRYVIFAEVDQRNNKYVHSEPIEILVDKNTKALKLILAKPGSGYEAARIFKTKPSK
jgi:Carboxypeptidase regulatory-like domain